MANVDVTYDELDSAAQQLVAGRDAINGELDNLKAYIDQLVTSGFITDEASPRFQEVFSEYVINSQELVNTLGNLSGYLNNAVARLAQTDSGQAAQLG